MNRKLLTAAALAVLMAAGCSSAPARSEAPASSQAPVSSKAQTSQEAGFDSAKSAVTSAGFTIQNEETEGKDWSADLLNDSGTVDISVERKVNAETARAEYKSELDDLQNDGYMQINTYSSTDHEMTVMLNDVDNVYGIVGVDDTAGEVVTMEDILESNKDACMSVMKALGFTTTD